MPSAPQWLRDKFPGFDTEALDLLHDAGYRQTRGGCWLKPSLDHVPTERENEALDFMFYEFDFGDIVGYIGSDGKAHKLPEETER